MNPDDRVPSLQLEDLDGIRAARAAMRVWPALGEGAQRTDLEKDKVKAQMMDPWKKISKINWELLFERSRIVPDLQVPSKKFMRELDHSATIGLHASAAAAAVGGTSGDPTFDSAAADAARAAAIEAAGKDSQIDDATKLLESPLWPIQGNENFRKIWKPVVDEWQKTMEALGLGIWVERYEQACERGFTEEEARDWFLGDLVSKPTPMPFREDRVAFAEFLYHFADEFELSRLNQPSFEKLKARYPDGIPSEAELREEIERGLSISPPDPLWLSWFTETQYLKVWSMFEKAWWDQAQAPPIES